MPVFHNLTIGFLIRAAPHFSQLPKMLPPALLRTNRLCGQVALFCLINPNFSATWMRKFFCSTNLEKTMSKRQSPDTSRPALSRLDLFQSFHVLGYFVFNTKIDISVGDIEERESFYFSRILSLQGFMDLCSRIRDTQRPFLLCYRNFGIRTTATVCTQI